MRSLCKLVIQVGIIGYRNHAKRIISLLNVKEDVKIKYIFHPVKSSEKSINTNNISDLFKCDAIFIISPNHTHFEYIKKFIHNFNGYIFCEKIPVVSIEELEWLKKIPEAKKSKIFFNFNYRFRGVSELIKKYLNSEQIGRVIHINIISTHGLAFKQSYIDSWRSNTELNPHSVLETSTVHFIDSGIDTGPIILQDSFEYDDCHSLIEVRIKAMKKCSELMIKSLILLEFSGYSPKSQNPSLGINYSHLPTDKLEYIEQKLSKNK